MRLLAVLSLFVLLLSWTILDAWPSEQHRQSSNQASFDERRREALSKNPGDVTFVIRLKNDNIQFKQGEIIPIELVFSSSTPRKYQLDGATYDRSGWLGMETFYLDPSDGAVDPLRDYFSSEAPPRFARRSLAESQSYGQTESQRLSALWGGKAALIARATQHASIFFTPSHGRCRQDKLVGILLLWARG